MAKQPRPYSAVTGIGAVLFLATVVVFSPVSGHEFLGYDDNLYVTDNYFVSQGLTWESIRWAFTTDHAANWHPVTWLSHMLDVELFGKNAAPMLWGNVVLHAINGILLLLILYWTTGRLWPAAGVGALFALHPLHVESVAWISERKDVLSTLFWLLTTLAYIGYVRTNRWLWYGAAFAFFALGLMSKPMLVTLPFVLLLMDYWPLNRIEKLKANQAKRPVLEKIPFFLLTVVSSVITFSVQRAGGAVSEVASVSLGARLLNAVNAYGIYLYKTIAPFELAVLYPHHGENISLTSVALSIMALVALTGVFIYVMKRRRYAGVGWLWYLGTLVPVIGLVQVGSQAYADRYTYVPLIGIFIIIAYGVADIAAKWNAPRSVVSVGSGIVLLGFAGLTYNQVGHWKNEITLFRHAIAVTENNVIAHTNLGHALNREGRYREAADSFVRAVEIKSDHPGALMGMGNTLLRFGKVDEAISFLERAASNDPDRADIRLNLGNALLNARRPDEAEKQYRAAIALDPYDAKAYNALAVVLISRGDREAAIRNFQRAIQLDPTLESARHNLNRARGTETAPQS